MNFGRAHRRSQASEIERTTVLARIQDSLAIKEDIPFCPPLVEHGVTFGDRKRPRPMTALD